MESTTAGAMPEVPAADVRSLLAAERAICVELWTVLEAMRIRGELPSWVRENFPHAGTSRQATERRHAAAATDAALFDGKRVEARFGLGQVLDVDAFELVDNATGERVTGTAADIAGRPSVAEQLVPSQLRRLAVGVAAQARAA